MAGAAAPLGTESQAGATRVSLVSAFPAVRLCVGLRLSGDTFLK